MSTTTEIMRVEVEMRAREALTQFEKLDAQFRETSGNNKALYQQLWREHKKYVGDVERENKKRISDERWLTNSLNKEVRERSKNEQWLARELEKEEAKRKRAIIARSKDEQWLTRELAKEQKQRERDAERAAREAERSNQKTSRFGGNLGGIGDKVMLAYGAVDAARGLANIADWGLRAADSLAGVHRGLETVYGSSERAAERFDELNELAKLPGLDPEPLARFDAIFKNLGSTAEQNDILFTGLAKSVTTFGGDAFKVESALYQLSQAFSKGKIETQDFKIIQEATGGTFIKIAEEVLGVTGGIEGLREAYQTSGDTLQNYLTPVAVRLNEVFEGAPVDSYTNSIQNLGVAFNKLAGEMFSNASFVGKFLGKITEFVEGEKELWENMRTGGKAIKAVGDEARLAAAEQSVLQKDLFRVSSALETQKEKYQELKDKGIHPNTASMQHLDRSIKSLEATHEKLSGRVDTAKSKMMDMLKPVKDIDTEFKVLKVDIDAVDTRFMTFRERGDALKGTISELPPELTRVREGLSESTTWAANLEKQFDALRGSTERVYDVFVDLNAGLDDYTEKAEQAWQASRGPLTDISGAERPGADFTAAQRRLYQPANIENARRSYATSPRGDHRGTQGDAFLGKAATKVREFEEVTDISIDKLDEFNAQTQQTAAELEKLNQKELADFGKSLFDAVNAVDTLTPMLESFGVDLTSQRSHGRLAVNTTSGIGQVLSGDVFGGLSNIIKSMWEWGQPSREALQQQHEAALEGERQRVARIQRELDAYDAQRENLLAGRMDFLMHGESTFEDWTDTLKSFSDHDLKRGQQVFAAFSEAMDAFNNEANQARLKLAPTTASNRYNLYQRLSNRGYPQGHRTTRAEADATALASGMTTPEEMAPAAQAELDPAIAQLASFSADQTFSDNVEAFRNAINATGQTIEGINAAIGSFTENVLRPEFDRLRGLILDDDGVISVAEELALRQAGVFSFEDFSAPFLQLGEDAISGIQATESALSNYVAESGFSDNVTAFRMSINSAGTTIADVNTAWQGFVENTLRPEFQRIRGLILDDDGVISAAEELALRQASVFTFEDFTDGFTGIKDAAISGIETADSALANYVSESGFEGNVAAFRMSINTAGLTVADVNTAWSTFQENTLRPEFERIRGLILDDDGIIDAVEELALRQAGVFTFEDFTGQFTGIKDAAVMGITTAETALANYVDESGFSDNVSAFRSSVNAAGTTVVDINAAWSTFQENTLRPEFERIRGLILDDDGIIDAVEELALRQAGVFTFEDFTGQFTGIKDAAVMGIQTADAALANYVDESGFEENVTAFRTSLNSAGLTVADVNTAWGVFVENTLRPEFERLRGLILDDDGIIDAVEELALRRAGLFTFEDFTGGFVGIKEAAVMGIQTADAALANYVAGTGFEDNVEAFKNSISAIGTTIADVNTAWDSFVENTLRPEFERIRGLILDDDGIISASEELALRQAGVFTFEDFTGGFAGIRDAAVSGIQNAQQVMASRQSSNARRGDRFNIRQARFNLGGATSEQEFIDLFGILGTAINTFYDNEEARIEALGMGVEETTRLLAENDQSRREELRGLSNITNTFAEERIRTEKQKQKQIDDLKDDAVEAEENRLGKILGLQARHNKRRLDLETGFLRDLEDLRRARIEDAQDDALSYQRELEDLQTQFTRKLFSEAISFSGLTAEQKRQVTESTGFQQGLFDLNLEGTRETQDRRIEFGTLRPGSAGYNFYRQQLESGELTDQNLIKQLFGREGLGDFTSFERGTADAATKMQLDILDVNTASRDLLTSIDTSLKMLTQGEQVSGVVVQGGQTQPPNITVMIDSEQIVTPQFAEQVSDQLSVNAQSGAARR